MIKARDISRLKNGEMPYSLQGKPFVVIKQFIQMIFTENYSTEWIVTDNPGKFSFCPVPKATAMQIISRFQMSCTCNTEDGKVFELPGSPFKEKYSKRKQ